MDLVRLKHTWIAIGLIGLAGCARFQPKPLTPSVTADNFEARSLADPGLKQFLEINQAHSIESWPLKSWDFESLHLAALYYHPSLDVARAQWQVALGGKITAAQMPNPTVSAVPGYDINPADGLTPWFPAITFDIPIETAGKRGYRRAEAQHLSESARWNIASTAWQVRSNLRASWIDFAFAQARSELLRKQTSTQTDIVHSLEQQLKAGAVSSSELGLSQIALNKMQLDMADALQLQAEAKVRVADAIGVTVAALDGIVMADVPVPTNATSLTSQDARRQALLSRPDIRSALSEYAASQSALQLEIAKQYPDIHLGPGYQYDQGDHKFSLSITAELPLLQQNQGPIAEAEARRVAAAARFNALQAKVVSEIDRALAAYRIAQENAATLEALAAAQKQRADAIEAQFRAGAADRLDLFNAQLERSAGELLQLSGRVKLQQALSALEDGLQRPIDSIKPSRIEQFQRPSPTQEKKP